MQSQDVKLPWGWRLLVGLVFAAGVAAVGYVGILAGIVTGLTHNADEPNAPRPGVGMAPDLTPAINTFFNIGIGGALGLILGLAAGCLLMWVG